MSDTPSPSTDELPATGSDAHLLIAAGSGLVALGVIGIVVLGRRRHDHDGLEQLDAEFIRRRTRENQ